MKDSRMERLIVLPFVAGCVSTSSIAVCSQQPQAAAGTAARKLPKQNTIVTFSPSGIKDLQAETLSSENMRNSFRFLAQALPKPNISIGLQRLSKSLKSFSHLFVFKEEMQEVEEEMEIGLPTDVKHVTHIGLDGSATTTDHLSTTISGGGDDHHGDCRGCDNIASEFLSLRPISLTQFELAMSTQHDAPLVH